MIMMQSHNRYLLIRGLRTGFHASSLLLGASFKAMALIFQVNPCRMGRRKQLRQIALLVLTLGVGPQVRGPLT